MLTLIILILGGLILVLVSINQHLRFKKLVRTGSMVEGIVYSTEASDSANMTSQYPTIRFVTHNKEWITEKYKMGLIPGIVKRRQTVKVFYNPSNPSEFVLDVPFFNIVIVALGVAGAILIGFGIIKLLQIT